MVKTARLAIISLSLVIAPTLALANGIVVNEVLVNEPGGRVSLEWFELFNDTQVTSSLLNITLTIDNQFVTTFDEVAISPLGFLVVCRDTVAFEERWGDSSGVWGDNSELENYGLLEIGFSLRNASGNITISSGSIISALSWPTSGADGISWERIDASIDSVESSTSQLGATPGKVNSASAVAFDWEIISVNIEHRAMSSTRLDVTIKNAGLQPLPAACLIVYDNPIAQASAQYGISGDSLFCKEIPQLNPADSVLVTIFISSISIYDTVGITIAGADERKSNSVRVNTIPGSEFPPIVINEFLANPQSPLNAEWVELKNISSNSVNFAGWSIGDELGVSKLDTSGAASTTIAPGGYLIVSQNASDMAMFYALLELPISVLSWRALNNTGDIVRLQDPFGFLADSVEYTIVFGDNVSRSRSKEPETLGLWGRSTNSGGTPGASNQTLLNADASDLSLSMSPNPFSPDGDGIDETIEIDITAPDGGNMSVIIYDAQGREVRSLFNGEPFSGKLTWDGKKDSGERVAIGLYIVYIEIENTATAKKTIVVAR